MRLHPIDELESMRLDTCVQNHGIQAVKLRCAARKFLDQHFDTIGVRSSIDLKSEVYSERG